jgi:hypothetical protein
MTKSPYEPERGTGCFEPRRGTGVGSREPSRRMMHISLSTSQIQVLRLAGNALERDAPTSPHHTDPQLLQAPCTRDDTMPETLNKATSRLSSQFFSDLLADLSIGAFLSSGVRSGFASPTTFDAPVGVHSHPGTGLGGDTSSPKQASVGTERDPVTGVCAPGEKQENSTQGVNHAALAFRPVGEELAWAWSQMRRKAAQNA